MFNRGGKKKQPEKRKCPLFWQQHWVSQRAGNPKRGRPLWERNNVLTVRRENIGKQRGTLWWMKRPRVRLGLELSNFPQQPWAELTVGNELINFPVDLTLKFYRRTAWHQSPTRTCFKPIDGAHGNPRKGDRASPHPPAPGSTEREDRKCTNGIPGKAKNTGPLRIPLKGTLGH